jgi:hypothetical protein
MISYNIAARHSYFGQNAHGHIWNNETYFDAFSGKAAKQRRINSTLFFGYTMKGNLPTAALLSILIVNGGPLLDLKYVCRRLPA